jgi:peptide/nickel transport system permease protein
MAEVTIPLPQQDQPQTKEKSAASGTFSRVAKYTLVRLGALLVTVIIGVYLTILIANMGGYVDEIRIGQIYDATAQIVQQQRATFLTTEEKNALIEQFVAVEIHRLGLDQPFVIRSFRYLTTALVLDLGRSENIASDSGSKEVRLVLLERLPSTLVLFGTANLLTFFVNLFFGLALSRRYGSLLDKLVVTLSPTSAAPAWFYGIFLILIFAGILGWFPFGGMVDAPPPESPWLYAASLGNHLVLPITAWMLSSTFLGIYANRTFFLIYSSEDYVELAKAKGLSSQEVERRYILRPTLPTIITSFALLVITLWTGAIITETVFNWPGLGQLLFRAIGLYDTPIIVASTVIYAYLLAITVFLLDFIYALVDPRVKVGSGG